MPSGGNNREGALCRNNGFETGNRNYEGKINAGKTNNSMFGCQGWKGCEGGELSEPDRCGDPVENAKFYDEQGADELVFLDITASHEKRKTILDVVARTADDVFMPLTVGGGIKSLDDIRDLLNAGCDKVSINTTAVHSPYFIREAAERFGSQCIVVAVDAKKVRPDMTYEPEEPWFNDEFLREVKLDLSPITHHPLPITS